MKEENLSLEYEKKIESLKIFDNFESNERDFFISIAKGHAREMSLHEIQGKLWEKDENGKDWKNVTEHCLMESARVGALARLIGLPEETRESLISAALVHDFNKKDETRLTLEDISKGGSGRKGVNIADEEAEKNLRSAGFSEIVLSLAEHVHPFPENTFFMKNIIDMPKPSSLGIAHLVAHYVDGYTRGSDWVEAVGVIGGKIINDVDRRSAKNASNKMYQKMNKEGSALYEGQSLFAGMTIFEAMVTLNHLIENKFFDILKERGVKVEGPLKIPELVDKLIKEEIKK